MSIFFNPFKLEFTIEIFIQYKPRIAVVVDEDDESRLQIKQHFPVDIVKTVS